MMYYLSYVEVSGRHSCLVLSQQESQDQPAKIIKNIGFFPRIDGQERANGWHFKTYFGHIRVEDIASAAAYSSLPVYHRTFPISNFEKNLFLKIVAEDENTNRLPFFFRGKSIEAGGADYQYLKFNCKTYALSVLERMRIVGAEELKDFLVQRPGAKVNKLHKIQKKTERREAEILCPEKDSYIKDANDELQILNEIVKNQVFERADLVYIMQRIRNVLHEASTRQQEKIGIYPYDRMNQFACLRGSFSLLAQILSGTGENENLVNLVKKHEKILQELDNRAKQIDTKHKNKELVYFWRGTPKLTKRYEIVTDEDMRIRMGIKMKDLSDSLQDILEMLDHARDLRRKEPGFFEDVAIIVGIVESSKASVKALLPKLTEEGADISQINQAVDQIILDLKNKMTEFEPQHKKSNQLVRLLDIIISFFQKSYVSHDADLVAKSAAENNLKMFKPKQPKLTISQKPESQPVPKPD